MKKIFSILLLVALLFTITGPAFAAGEPTQKEEVVYGVLGWDGGVQGIYVVNSFESGAITDYGDYREVSNLTSTEKLTQSGDRITIDTTADHFYYQGTLVSKALPWNVAIKYMLDGRDISARELAGKSGALIVSISTEQNDTVNPAFYNNYMLQVSLTLDTQKCADFASPGAVLANAGKNKVITHTVMPGKDADITITATVEDFSMDGVEFAAMPFSMSIDTPDTESLTRDMVTLSDAVSALNDGVKKLSESVAEICSGGRKLADGSSDFSNGLTQLSDNSGELLGASTQIKAALDAVLKSLDGENGGFDLGALAALPDGLRRLAGGLDEATGGIQALGTGYAAAYAELDSAISGIPDTDVDPSALYDAVDGNLELTATLGRLVGYYEAARTVKGTYAAVQEAFSSVEGNLSAISGSIGLISNTLSGMANEIEQTMSNADIGAHIRQLKEGLLLLSSNYGQFHNGLGEYMNGVNTLADVYKEMHTGIQSLAGGLDKLNAGAKDLYEGTSELNDSVADLPDTIQIEINKLTEQYDKSGYIPISFVSEKNTNVTAVQFVLKAPPIETSEAPQPPVAAPEKLTFWQKLGKLFGLYQ